MKSSITARESYHPRIDEDKSQKPWRRDSVARLHLIERSIDFTGKTVLDLGCSGGFFVFSIAKKARRVIGIDADLHMIERNRVEAKRLGYNNVEFIHARIEPQFLTQLPDTDIVLFLSVLHHILAASDVYDWNGPASGENALQLLSQIRQLAKIYVFEMGEPWASHSSWASRIERNMGNLPDWIRSHVFGPDYLHINTIPGPAYERWPFQRWPNLARPACRTRIGRTFLRQTGIHRSDFRTIYIGQRATQLV